MKREQHRQRHTLLYEVWKSMKQRCYNPKNKDFHHYGGRGVIVCNEWRTSFTAFKNHIDEACGERPGSGYSIDRIDNSRGYEANNIRWATQTDQVHNRRAVSKFNPKADQSVVDRIRLLRAQGMNYTEISRDVKVICSVQVKNILQGKRKSCA